ncbi:MAG: hypothetical protein IJ964_04145 [Campylobacter sp.]|uniref:YajG family lipoprotein n=1 Tax=Campylobacter sp. TaxID=205 RepID=UPI001B65A4A0|nr:YajG family lipoprotein [Campylobacter sp.]MBP3675703.1 hypothetical protein [Campylobacter sp.]MBR2148847.1 hypothetical protein [Campylobacter sp.]MBR2159137.1 hypothetical protein [Campylobacter sp.]MBR2164472.1 hypothetical protein [Campylobacter sp.]MBR2222257.1 hypothetical protein [Campylobacter sp.]
MRVAIFVVLMLCIGLNLTGCTSSSSVLSLSSYTPVGLNLTQKEISINSITDTRANKSIIATITDSKGSVEHSVIMAEDLKQTFAKALQMELKASNAILGGQNPSIVDIEIIEFSANLSGYSGQNLQGKSKLKIKIKNGDTIITKTISQPQGKYTPLPRVSAFQPFITDMLNDMVRATTRAILATN